MNPSDKSIFEANKMSPSEVKKRGEQALKELKSQNKKEESGQKKDRSEYVAYLNKQFAHRKQKYEEQKKRQLEKLKEREGRGHLDKAKASLSGIKIQKSSYKETDPTVAKKTLENMGSTAAGVAGAAYHGARYLLSKKKAAKKAEELKKKQAEKKEMGTPGRPKKQTSTATTSNPSESPREQKKLSGTPDRPKLVPSTKRLVPSTKRFPPSGGVPNESRGETKTLGQRARKNPALRAALIKSRMNEDFSNWRDELIIEVVENGEKQKKKVVDVMKGKNKITINPDIREETIEEIAAIIPAVSRIAGVLASRGVASGVSGGAAARGSLRSSAAELLGHKAGEMTADAVKKKLEKRFKNQEDTVEESAAWTRKEGQNKHGGLNEKGRRSYERENPGSDLKAPSKKVGNPRRASFCARMKGMKSKLTSEKTANDPNSRINKSLRAWNC